MTDAESTAKQADANLKSSEENTAQSDSKVDEAKAQWSAAAAGVDYIRAQLSESSVNVDSANLDLSYTKIFAPSDGYVTRKAVEPGDYVQVGQDLMAIVETNNWVVANFKETQLTLMRSNQPVTVAIDTFPGRTFRAHVESVQNGSGAQFSLFAAGERGGQFCKSRATPCRVKIVFDEPSAGWQRHRAGDVRAAGGAGAGGLRPALGAGNLGRGHRAGGGICLQGAGGPAQTLI